MDFVNRMSKRAHVGHVRYGSPDARKMYMSRIRVELQAYQKNGNIEHLYNIAVYCWLERKCPQNPKAHYDETVDSATRKLFA